MTGRSKEATAAETAGKTGTGTKKTDVENREEILQIIEVEYIAGDESIRELAARHGISKKCVADRCQKNGWVKKREKARKAKKGKLLGKRLTADVKRLEKAMSSSDKLDNLIDEVLTLLNSNPSLVLGNLGGLGTVAAALKNAIGIKRDLYDLPSEREKQQIKMTTEKLNLLKAQLEEKKRLEESGGKTEVTFVVDGDGELFK